MASNKDRRAAARKAKALARAIGRAKTEAIRLRYKREKIIKAKIEAIDHEYKKTVLDS